MPKWLDGLTVEIAVSIAALIIVALHIAARFYGRRPVTFDHRWRRDRKTDR